ncbi:molybdopterin-binding protein [Desulforamulus hydrothermalis]|uniref:Molybdopterin molybdenumtransferase n=1 Tax=Desulforamulus hydrothermalis Lam5 = DSM 18033 TaxID=1121428 RepID=K8EBX0_9FIRM|nr:molybdopterin-binding protein [Desulforamulus hydrothermalis]CCO09198.1 Molybdopterin binding domain protein [Desulforamulus hydrothermalis Lam5 = DSM 18033]SHH10844.1 Probable molybdopterin binding domain-containing protein [Desulforamulus hydrothermalis Lam5 = DSM 18033]
MKMVPVQEAVGMVLCHDITQIIPGKFKGRAFKKGHIVKFEDIPRLLDLGKQNLYVWEINKDLLHEDDAALRIARAAAGHGITLTEPKEGKVNLVAKEKGLLKVNSDALYSINELEDVMFATLHTNQIVEKDKVLAGTRIIPLVIKDDKIRNIENICRINYPLIEVKPFRSLKVGVVTTGSEVYHGRIQDEFGPVVTKKIASWGSYVFRQIFVSDSTEMIVNAINQLLREGAEMITATGGMSVDPDDLTPAGIRAAGGRIVTYGAPTLPGAMFMVAYMGKVPVLGLPGCVMYSRSSIFDLVVPRILAGEEITRRDIVALGHGGLCVNCKECRYPDCGFGK